MGIYYNSRIVTNGLLVAFDAGNPKSWPGSGTTLSNLNRSQSNLTLTNGPTYNSANGGYFIFDGVDDTSTSNTGMVGAAGDSFTHGCWMQALSGVTSIGLSRGHDGAGSGWSLFTSVDNGTGSLKPLAAAAPSVPSVVGLYCFGTTTLVANNWYYIVGKWVPGAGVTVYLNGIQDGFLSSTSTNLRSSTVGWQFSRAGASTTRSNVASAHAYNRALTDAEIYQNFVATKGRYGY